MSHILAAIQSGTDPIAPLPPASFHRTLEDPIYCPKCDATYMLIADYDWAVSRHFTDESRRHLSLLRKAIFQAHSSGHRTTHYDTNGVIVTSHKRADPPTPLEDLRPVTKHIN